MRIWAAGLSTRASAKSASKWGGIACLIAAAREALGIVVQLSIADKTLGHAIAWLIGASIVPIIIAVAGFELLRGGGRFSGSLALLLVALDQVLASWGAMSVNLIISIIVMILLFLFMVNGVRGAFALRHIDFDKELRDAFN